MRRVGRLLWMILAVGVGVWLIRLFGGSLLRIPEDGERPVFYAGDRVWVNKTAYGVRLPLMRWIGYRRWGDTPVERGEWTAFNDPSSPQDTPIDERDVFIGYCFAVPGDSLWIDSLGGIHRRKPSAAHACKVVELPRKNAYVAITPDNILWYNQMINSHEGVRSAVIGDSLCVSGRCKKSFRFTHDYYWMSSADPKNHADSRTFGFVPETHLIGRLTRIFYSMDHTCPWYFPFRKERFLMKVNTGN